MTTTRRRYRRREPVTVIVDMHARIALCLSILNHRPWSPEDQPHIDQARRALLGATIDDLQNPGGQL